ncbi:hypothetical protein H5T51_00675 [Candidatus Bathyarchaeota archaeon]|nr:hypothetical protein [Candidatus Bathyarchaeota archaeon]
MDKFMEKDMLETSLMGLVESLPEGLRNQFKEDVAPLYSSTKCWVIAAVAKHLVAQGCNAITFRKALATPGDRKFYVDIYCGDRNLYIICLDGDAPWLFNRLDAIRRIDMQAKVVVAAQDWLAWALTDMSIKADEVWVVSREGLVLRLMEWIEKRRQLLVDSALNTASKLEELWHHFNEVKENYESTRRAGQDLCNNICGLLVQLTQALGMKSVELVANREYQTEKMDLLNGLWAEMRITKNEMLKAILNLANKLLAVYTPYVLSITEKGGVYVYRDPSVEQWIGWNRNPELARTMAMQKELAIIAEAAKKAEKFEESSQRYDLLHFTTQAGAWPPQTVTVPITLLEKMLRTVNHLEERLEKIRTTLMNF